MEKTKIAVLGSGPAALGTVWEITESPNWSERFEIDVYVLGWRLGGKTASGRDPGNRHRNEEHGLHILGGFYHNTFQQLRPLYDAWNRKPENRPIPFAEAFFKHNIFSIMQRDPNKPWRELRVTFPDNGKVPGVDPTEVGPIGGFTVLLEWFAKMLHSLSESGSAVPGILVELNAFAAEFDEAVEKAKRKFRGKNAEADVAETLDLLDRFGAWFDEDDPAWNPAWQDKALFPIEGADWIGVIGLAGAILTGILRDRIFWVGYDTINHIEASAWLKHHGASDRARRCGLFQAGYHYAFAYTDGDMRRPDFAAGTALRGYLRLIFASHGAVFYHMNGGMGEIVALPYYDVLVERGVRFHFFHKTVNLEADDSGYVSAIEFEIQAKTRGGAPYQPIIEYEPSPGSPSRRSWPARPLFDQLVKGKALKQSGADFEAFHATPPGATRKRIERGREFDLCVLAIPSPMLKLISRPLAAKSPAWAEMLAATTSSPTIAAQTWRAEPVATFGGTSTKRLMTAFEPALDTWADMSFLVRFENGPATGKVLRTLSYFCGVVPLPVGLPPAQWQAAEQLRSARLTEQWMRTSLVRAFPGLRDPAGQDSYNTQTELERITLINSDPAKLYVTSATGTIDKRLRPGDSGFANLLLAGDWTRHNFDCGAVEPAIISARVCSRHICGSPVKFYGESDFG